MSPVFRTAGLVTCVAAIAATVGWVRGLPADLHGVEGLVAAGLGSATELRDAYRFRGDDGREHVYLGGFDSYAWAIAARKVAINGTPCDEHENGICRDLGSLAPLGRTVQYPHSLHVRAIAALHELVELWRPGTPLLTSARWLSTAVAVVAVVPACIFGYRLAGWVGLLVAGLLTGLNPFLLGRTLGGDNDVWSVLLPLTTAWLVCEAVLARRTDTAVALAAAAGAVIGPYAGLWKGWPFAWSMALAGLVANAVLLVADATTHRPASGHRKGAEVATAFGMIGAFLVAAGVSTAIAGASPSYLDALPVLLDNRLLSSPAEAATGPALSWPDPYDDVHELRSLGLGEVAFWAGGPFYLFVGWLGVCLMLLPRRGWRGPHFGIFLAGVLLYRLLLSSSVGGTALQARWLLPAVLMTPPAAAVGLYAFDSSDGARRRAAITVVVWFVAATYLALGSVRFLLLMIPPFAIATAVAFDRLRGWVFERGPRPSVAAARLAAPATALAVAGFLYFPVRAGFTVAQNYLPVVNDAWYETLTEIDERAPPNAIVSTWWPFGYFAGYFADRRVTSDGGSLYSSAPYWLARAMMAPSDKESAAILRLLHCGGAAPGNPETSPRFAPLLAAGLSPYQTMMVVDELFHVGAADARKILSGHGLSAQGVDQVLSVTHCQPPSSYLVLSDLNGRDASWQRLAAWSLPRAFAANEIRRREPGAVASDLEVLFSIEPATARSMVAEAETATRAGRLDAFATISPFSAPSAWAPCIGSGDTLECGVRVGDVTGAYLRLDRPDASRLRGVGESGPPSFLLTAGGKHLDQRAVTAAPGGWSILYDSVERRALIGDADVLRSTWARLTLLQGRYEKFFARTAVATAAGETVTAWRVRWDRVGESD